jgi:hypothetical protein
MDRGWLWHARGPSVPCAVEAVDAAADGAGRHYAGVDAAPGAAGEAPGMSAQIPREEAMQRSATRILIV